MKTSCLEKDALNWAVAKARGYKHDIDLRPFPKQFNFDTCWAKAGPIIEGENIWVIERFPGVWDARKEVPYEKRWDRILIVTGNSYLEAAMRCYAVGKLGDVVEVPENLTQGFPTPTTPSNPRETA